MTVLTDTWRGLVQRRLWPVALLLVAALAALPFVLASDEAPVAPGATSAAPSGDDAVAGQPIVAVASNAQRERGRNVVGERKDPFRPAVPAKQGRPQTETTASTTAGAAPKPDAPASDAPAGGGGGVTPGVVTPGGVDVGAKPAPKHYELYSLTVRFGDSASEQLTQRNLRRLKALPNVAEPVLIYLGIMDDGKTAVFMLDASAVVQGDGTCEPSPENCQTLHMRVGDTEFIDVMDGDQVKAQYELDLVKIHKRTTVSARAARRAYHATADGGRQALRTRLSRVGPFRYDSDAGRVMRISARAAAAGAH